MTMMWEKVLGKRHRVISWVLSVDSGEERQVRDSVCVSHADL